MEKIVTKLITELRSSTIQINIRLSFAQHILMDKVNASMGNSAPLHTTKTSCLWNSLKSLFLIWISIFFISRLFGVLIERTIMRGMSVCMHITGKITGGSPQYSRTQKRCAKTGPQRSSSPHTKKVAPWNTNVNSATVGKSKNFIQTSLRWNLAFMGQHVKNPTALITMGRLTGSTHYPTGSNMLLKPELWTSPLISMYRFWVN